jgi:hypothetical protein
MQDLVAAYKESAIKGMEEFLKDLSFVPDDKLTWTLTPTAKSALRIAAHTALYAGRFARMINARRLPGSENIAERRALQNAEEAALTSRAEVEAIFRRGTDEVIAALDSLTAEEVGATLDSGFGWSIPMTRLLEMPGLHAWGHGAQLDYLQTCWDDQEVHF